jgi:hypothetical protein
MTSSEKPQKNSHKTLKKYQKPSKNPKKTIKTLKTIGKSDKIRRKKEIAKCIDFSPQSKSKFTKSTR